MVECADVCSMRGMAAQSCGASQHWRSGSWQVTQASRRCSHSPNTLYDRLPYLRNPESEQFLLATRKREKRLCPSGHTIGVSSHLAMEAEWFSPRCRTVSDIKAILALC